MEGSLKKGQARIFLREVVAKAYNFIGVFSEFEGWVREYDGEHKEYLDNVVKYLQKRNSKGDSRIFGINNSTIEDILDATISPKVP